MEAEARTLNLGEPPVENTLKQAAFLNTLKVCFSLIATTALALVLKMFLPRVLGAENMGVFYTAESFSLAFFSLLPLGIGTYISREIPVRHDHLREIMWSVSVLQFLMSIGIFIAMLATLMLLHYRPNVILTTAIMGGYMAIFVFQRNILHKSFLALGKVGFISILDIGVKLILVVTASAVLLSTKSLSAIAFCFFFSEFIGLLAVMHISKKQGFLSFTCDWVLLKRIVVSSLPFFANALLATVYTSLGVVILSKVATEREVGLYGAAARLQGVFLILVPVIGSVFMPILAREYRAHGAGAMPYLSQLIKRLVAASFLLSAGLVVLGDFTSNILYGAGFRDANLAVCILAPGILLTYLNVLLSAFVNICTNGKRLALVTGGSIVLNSVLTVALVRWTSHWGPGGAGAGAALATIASEIFVCIALFRLIPHPIMTRKLARSLIASAAALGGLLLVLNHTNAISPFVRLAVAMIALPAFLLVTGMVDWDEVRQAITMAKSRLFKSDENRLA